MKIINMLLIFLFISFCIASITQELGDSTIIGNVTFTGNENYTKNISIYRYANISYASLDISGFSTTLREDFSILNTEGITTNGTYIWAINGLSSTIRKYYMNFTYTGEQFTGSYNFCGIDIVNETELWAVGCFGSSSNFRAQRFYHNGTVINTLDYSGQTFSARGIFANETYVWIVSPTNGFLRYTPNGTYITTDSFSGCSFNSFGMLEANDTSIFLLCGNDIKEYDYSGVATGYTLDISHRGNLDAMFFIGTTFYTNPDGVSTVFYNDSFIPDYPINPQLYFNNISIWSASNGYIISESVDNFSSETTQYLNNSLCNCVTCSLVGDYCYIDLIFSSETSGILQYSNINITYTETILPVITYLSPATSLDTLSITISLDVSEDDLDTCYYNITRGASIEKNNEIFNSSLIDTYSLSGEAIYIIHTFCNDTSGNFNYANRTISVNIPDGVGGGGGGGGTVIIQGGNTDWTVETESGADAYILDVIYNTARIKSLFFENIGNVDENIRLECRDIKGDLCNDGYIEFDETEFSLPIARSVRTVRDFTVLVDEDVELGEYVFNIAAIDSSGGEGIITVTVNVKNFSFVAKLVSDFVIGGIRIPYIATYVLIFMVVFFASLFILKNSDTTGKGGISFLISSFVVIITFFLF